MAFFVLLLVLEKNRWDLGASSTSTALLSTKKPAIQLSWIAGLNDVSK